MKTKHLILGLTLVGLACLATLSPQLSASPLGVAFTYQGRLSTGTNAANGRYDLKFGLYDALTGGSQVGSSLTNTAVSVTNGYFTVTLDFGSVFDGDARWLEIGVRTNGSGAFTTLSPRQPLTPSPYALYAPSAGTATTANNVGAGSIVNASLAANAVTSDKIADSTIAVADLSPAVISNTFWRLAGNAGTTPGTHFLGTTDGQALEVRVNNARALRLEPGASAPNVIGGYAGNMAASGISGATIGGGGAAGLVNTVSNSYATIAGGYANLVQGQYSTIGGGTYNTIRTNNVYATIAGGNQNTIEPGANYASIGGGGNNHIETGAYTSTIGGGGINEILPAARYSVIGGGLWNCAGAEFSVIGGGWSNTNAGQHGVIVGGRTNLIASTGIDSFIGGGWSNVLGGTYSVISGGQMNTIETNNTQATIAGGKQNTIETGANTAAIGGGGYNRIETDAYTSTIGGGAYNEIWPLSHYSVIGGGLWNTLAAESAFVGGGQGNFNVGLQAVIVGGLSNLISATGDQSFIGGGWDNQIWGDYSTIAGGAQNSVSSSAAYAAIGGGSGNNNSGLFATIGGGIANNISGPSATIGGGMLNSSGGDYATVPGGESNTADGLWSFAAGRRAKALHAGTFVWADSTDADFTSTATKQFLIRAVAVGINTNNPQATLHVNGTARVKVLQIDGGADVAEPFEMSDQEIPKGAVVVIDEANPGRLKLSKRAYDNRVAGIVSGANGISPGLTLSQEPLGQGGQNVALSGRVYAFADASTGPIQPGDLLTTSSVPGHAMKAADPARTHGAILGKAMSGLKEGQGLVLVLVSLQ